MIDTDTQHPAGASDPAMLARLAAVVGLPLDSQPDAILAAIFAGIGLAPPAAATASELPDPKRYVPVDAVQELLADRNARIATQREAEAEAKVDRAFREGHITPAMIGWAKALCTQDPASFDAFLAKSPAPYAHLTREVSFPTLPPRGGEVLAVRPRSAPSSG